MENPARLPLPPIETVANNAVGDKILMLFAAAAIATVIYALYLWWRRGNPLPLLIVLGGLICYCLEPFLDIVGGCWHPEVGQKTGITLMGRSMPTWLFPTYVVYFGFQPMLAYLSFPQGLTRRAIWLSWIIPVLTDIVLEISLLQFDIYHYYGNQPLVLMKFPLWWASVNSLGVLASVLAIIALFRNAQGAWRLAAMFTTPVVYIAVFTVGAFPALVAINSDFPFWVNQLLGLVTFGFATTIVYALAQTFATDREAAAQPLPA